MIKNKERIDTTRIRHRHSKKIVKSIIGTTKSAEELVELEYQE